MVEYIFQSCMTTFSDITFHVSTFTREKVKQQYPKKLKGIYKNESDFIYIYIYKKIHVFKTPLLTALLFNKRRYFQNVFVKYDYTSCFLHR